MQFHMAAPCFLRGSGGSDVAVERGHETEGDDAALGEGVVVAALAVEQPRVTYYSDRLEVGPPEAGPVRLVIHGHSSSSSDRALRHT
jgi:hypothetical protein